MIAIAGLGGKAKVDSKSVALFPHIDGGGREGDEASGTKPRTISNEDGVKKGGSLLLFSAPVCGCLLWPVPLLLCRF